MCVCACASLFCCFTKSSLDLKGFAADAEFLLQLRGMFHALNGVTIQLPGGRAQLHLRCSGNSFHHAMPALVHVGAGLLLGPMDNPT